jgi:hypothetical protein
MPASASKPNGDKPTVDFNFDTWEAEGAAKPFGVVIGGKRYEAVNPVDLDYREFENAEDDPGTTFKLLFPDDYEEILAHPRIKVGALQEFNKRVMDHYGLGNTAAS